MNIKNATNCTTNQSGNVYIRQVDFETALKDTNPALGPDNNDDIPALFDVNDNEDIETVYMDVDTDDKSNYVGLRYDEYGNQYSTELRLGNQTEPIIITDTTSTKQSKVNTLCSPKKSIILGPSADDIDVDMTKVTDETDTTSTDKETETETPQRAKGYIPNRKQSVDYDPSEHERIQILLTTDDETDTTSTTTSTRSTILNNIFKNLFSKLSNRFSFLNW